MMRLVRVTALGDDRLEIVGDLDGEEVIAHGWVSAMTNHFDSSDYGLDGHREYVADEDGTQHEVAVARQMTEDEKVAYWHRLLDEQAERQQDRSSSVLFEAEPEIEEE